MKTEKKTVHVVEYQELEEWIRQVYEFEDPKHMFSVVAMEEWNNDSEHLFPLRKEPLDKWQQKELDDWKSEPLGYHSYKLHTILQDMTNNGRLEEGNLLVSVYW